MSIGLDEMIEDLPEDTLARLCTGAATSGDQMLAFNILSAMKNTRPALLSVSDVAFLRDVITESVRARSKFPKSDDSMVALTEECGETAKALLEHKYGKAPAEDIWNEAVQTAVMAMRVAVEGDPSMGYNGRQR